MFVLILASTASSTKVRVLAEARIVGALPGGHLPGFCLMRGSDALKCRLPSRVGVHLGHNCHCYFGLFLLNLM